MVMTNRYEKTAKSVGLEQNSTEQNPQEKER